MTLSKLASAPVDLSSVGPVAVAAIVAAPDGDTLEAILAASATRSAKLSPGMTQLLLEVQSSLSAPNDASSLRTLFRPKR